MDPNVQVAFVTVLGVTISTVGVVLVAVINNQKEREKAASEGVDAGLDERDILSRLVKLIAENDRKEAAIQKLKEENRMLRAENTQLRLQLRGKDHE